MNMNEGNRDDAARRRKGRRWGALAVGWAIVLSVTLIIFGRQAMEMTETAFLNGSIWTGVEGAPRAQAMLVRDGEILAIGRNETVERLMGPRTEIVDLGGAFVVPGFIDNHVHFMTGGFRLAGVDLRDAGTPGEFVRRLEKFAEDLPEGRWILGGDWDHEAWGGDLPRRDWIDAVTADVPVFVNRLDGHMGLANSRALELAGITAETPDPPGGEIVRDEQTREPTGMLRDEAMGLVYRVVPEESQEERDEAVRRSIDHALANGVTQVHDMGSWASLETYRRLHRDGEMGVRIYSIVPLSTWERLRDFVARNGRGDERVRWGGLKGFVDGSLGSTTAWFYDPYDDAPKTTGLMVTDTTELRRQIIGADGAGLHVVVHAIGDRANDWLLDVYRDAVEQNGPRDRRFRIEHAQHLSREAIARFGAQGVIPSMQPYHAIDDGRWAENRIGRERIRTTYAFRSLIDAGAPLTFGSDWTVAPISPLEGIYAAVTRRTLDGAHPGGWVPEEIITVEEALRAYTSASAYGGFQEERLGTLQVGNLADFVVLSEDLFAIDPARIRDVRVLRTVVDGRSTVFE